MISDATRRVAKALCLQKAAAEAIAAAMHATLPGIDANDERKTRAVFRLYCMVLVSVGPLDVRDSNTPGQKLLILSRCKAGMNYVSGNAVKIWWGFFEEIRLRGVSSESNGS